MLELTGNAITGYRILRSLGRGTIGTVYIAVQESFNREVALKVIATEFSKRAGFGELFLREAQLAIELKHPNIIVVHDVGCCGQHFYIATEVLSGALNARKSITTAETLRIALDVSCGLSYAHQRKIIHCGVKPSNIMFRDDAPVLTEFGIYKALNEFQAFLEFDTTYISPEQAQGLRLDGRSDLYSLGTIVYEMLTGRPPFYAADTLSILIMRVLQSAPRLPTEHAALQPVLDRLLAPQLEDRYLSADAFMNAVAPFLSQQTVKQKTRAPALNSLSTIEPPAIRKKAVTSSVKRSPLLAVIAISVCFALALSFGIWRWSIAPAPVVVRVPAATKPMLIASIRERIASGSFFEPQGDSAFDSLKRLLNAMPGDPDVLALTRELSKEIAASVRSSWDREDRTEALTLLRKAQEWMPNDARLANLRADLQAKIEQVPIEKEDLATAQPSVSELLEHAERLRQRSQLTYPLGNNAVEVYQEVLRKDPQNTFAIVALEDIARDYFRVANTFRDRKRPDQALLQVQNGLKASPTDNNLLRLEQELEQELASANLQ